MIMVPLAMRMTMGVIVRVRLVWMRVRVGMPIVRMGVVVRLAEVGVRLPVGVRTARACHQSIS
jgi:hypothetical protein